MAISAPSGIIVSVMAYRGLSGTSNLGDSAP